MRPTAITADNVIFFIALVCGLSLFTLRAVPLEGERLVLAVPLSDPKIDDTAGPTQYALH